MATPEEYDKVLFARLWQQDGLSTKEMARRFDIADGTVSSRVTALKKAGLITTSRPKGGSYPHTRHRHPHATHAHAPAPAVPSTLHASSQLQEILAKVDILHGALADKHPHAMRMRMRSSAAVQWSARLTPDLIEQIKCKSLQKGIPPSHLVEQILREAFGMPAVV